jgi:hypothetical protein
LPARGRAEQIKPGEVVGGAGRALFDGALHHVEAERRILLDAAAADIQRAERAHGFGIASIGFLPERGRDLCFIGLDRGESPGVPEVINHCKLGLASIASL